MPRGRRSLATVLLRVVAVLVLVGVCAYLGSHLLARTRSAESQAAGQSHTYSPPPVATPQPALVSVISDGLSGYEQGSDAAKKGPKPWIAIVPKSLSIRVSPFVLPGSGYTTKGSAGASGSTFVTRASDVSAATRVAVLMGGAADQDASQTKIAIAATRALAAVRTNAKGAKLVVVGPAWPTAYPPVGVLAVRDALRAAAKVVDATWVDPIAGGWLQSSAALWDAQGMPTAAGQRELGTRMKSVLSKELDG